MTNMYLEKVAKSGFWTAVDKVSRGAEKGINAVGSGYQKAMKSKPVVAFNTMGKNKQTAVMAGVGAGAGLGIRAMAKKKVDDPAMTKVANIYLEKIAEDHKLKGLLSPAWQARAIAKEHGKQGDEGIGKHIGGGIRYGVRGGATSVGGAMLGGAIGAGAGIALKRPKLAGVGTLAGLVGGSIRGVKKSLKNQADEAHAKYSK